MAKYNKLKKYFKSREVEGKPQIEAEKEANYASDHHGTRIEKTKLYSKLMDKYSDVLKNKTNFDELADIQLRNAKQPKDVGGSNKAVESIINKMEPPEATEMNTGDVQIIVKKND